jgi:hypothetical protein
MDSKSIIDAVTGVTAKWAKQRKAEERKASSMYNRRSAMTRSYRTTIKDAAWGCMEAAYLKASSNGTLPAQARQVMYAARPEILRRADGVETLRSEYFTQQLLPEYMATYPHRTASWDVVFDARGNFLEPHTNRQVALGTLDVRHYLRDISAHAVEDISANVSGGALFPTVGPKNRYSAILFIEKEGFMPLFQKVGLAQQYDIAIMSTKGMSSTAARHLIDRLCTGIPLLVLHDFDKAGFSILGTLQRDTRRYTFAHNVNVIDLGIRLEDVEQYTLESEDCVVGKSDPSWNLAKNGATQEEIDFLCAGRNYRHYVGKRVELNAFTSGDFLDWIKGKLQSQGIDKVIPDDATVEAAYRRAALVARLDSLLQELIEEAREEVEELSLPEQLTQEIGSLLGENRRMSWDQAITEIVTRENHKNEDGQS